MSFGSPAVRSDVDEVDSKNNEKSPVLSSAAAAAAADVNANNDTDKPSEEDSDRHESKAESSVPAALSSSSSPTSSKKKSVTFTQTGRVRWFLKKESIVSANIDDEEYQVDFSEVKRKVLRKRVLKSHARVQSMPFSMSLLDDKGAKEQERRQNAMIKPITIHNNTAPRKQMQVVLLHSQHYTQILYHTMKHIHQDRDLLLEALLKWCGFFHGAKSGALASFLTILPPKLGTRKLLELFHDSAYLDLLEFPSSSCYENKDSEGESEGVENEDIAKQDKSFHHDFDDVLAPFSLDNDEEEKEQIDIQTHDNSNNDALLRKVLAEHGLEDDCPLPTDDYSRALLWKYCLYVAGASWHAASLLVESENDHHADIVVNWGGGRHHAHSSKAGGFCYVNDIVLAIKRLLHCESIDQAGAPTPSRVLYIDIDIHHSDGVQQAFYSSDRVLTTSFHRNAPGFFPSTTGFVKEKGAVDTDGFGYNLNVPLPTGTGDAIFLKMYRKLLFGLVKSYDPDFIVLCVGADGLEGDALVAGKRQDTDHSLTGEGWSLSPEGLAECVRIASSLCSGLKEDAICSRPKKNEKQKDETAIDGSGLEIKDDSGELGKRRKLLVLGGGGYTPTQTARTNLLCTAAACEGARRGMLWSELPKDIPSHEYFPRYGPYFELVTEEKKQLIWDSYDPECTNHDDDMANDTSSSVYDGCRALQEGIHAIELACLFIDRQQRKKTANTYKAYDESDHVDNEIWVDNTQRKKKASKGGGRRRKKKKEDHSMST